MTAVRLVLLLAVMLTASYPAYAGVTELSGVKKFDAEIAVGRDDTLRVMPGARLTFGPGAGIRVEGTLEVSGTAGSPAVLTGEGWGGIRAAAGSVVKLANAEIDGARDALRMSGGTLSVKDVTVRSCVNGIKLETLAVADIEGLKTISVDKDSVSVRQDSRAAIRDSSFSGPGNTGVKTVGKCRVDVKGSSFRKLDAGVRSSFPGSSPVVTGCTFEENEHGAYSEYPEAGARLSACTFVKNEYGIYAKRLSSPSVTGGVIRDGVYGVYSTEGSSPEINGCLVTGNRYGVYVTFSSYPKVHGCDLSGNRDYAAYLDEQSYDWVHASGDDTRRRNMGMRAAAGGRGGEEARQRGQSTKRYVNPKGAFVDFTGNYWGGDALAQMERNKGLGEVGAIYDYFDLNTDVYEGKRWTRDKVDYAGYLAESPVRR